MKRIISALVAVLLLPLAAFAQHTVSGTVTEAANGEPVIGASIMVQGTSTGVITDLDGTFTISAPSNAVLVFDCIGFKTVTVPVNGQP